MSWLRRFLKSGPELRMPRLKSAPKLTAPGSRRRGGAPRPTPPGFAGDLYADLRDRRLLPLIGVIALAIVAAPLLLGEDSESGGAPEAPRQGLGTAESAGFAVVPADPGLRDYRQRLAERPEEDPFEPKAGQPGGGNGGGGAAGGNGSGGNGGSSGSAGSDSSGSGGGGGSDSASVADDGGSSPAPVETEASGGPSGGGGSDGGGSSGGDGASTGGGSPGGGSQGGGGSGDGGQGGGPPRGSGGGGERGDGARFRVARAYRGVDLLAGVEGRKPTSRPAVEPLTKLPAKRNPVVVYMGLTKDGRRALFLLTSRVIAYNGKVGCAVDKFNCQLLEVRPGRTVAFVYGARETRYRLKVSRIVTILEGAGGKRRVLRP